MQALLICLKWFFFFVIIVVLCRCWWKLHRMNRNAIEREPDDGIEEGRFTDKLR